MVAGVISTTPGVTLGGSLVSREKALLAPTSIVPAKVTNEGSSIQPGNLLVTSSTPGHAMRSAAPEPCLCSLVGKALERANGRFVGSCSRPSDVPLEAREAVTLQSAVAPFQESLDLA